MTYTTVESQGQEARSYEITSVGGFVKRGLVAGGVAGLLSALYLLIVLEGPIDEALAIEAARHSGEIEHHHDDALFGRTTQVIGGMTGGVIYGLVVGLIFSLIFVRVRHRLAGADDFGRATRLAAAGFLTVGLIPGLKYPASPPGVGDPDTVNARTVQFVALMAVAIGLLMISRHALIALENRGMSSNNRHVLVTAGFCVAVSLAWYLWTPAGPIPDDMPAGLVWQFRILSMGALAMQWAVVATVFGLLVTRKPRTRPETASAS